MANFFKDNLVKFFGTYSEEMALPVDEPSAGPETLAQTECYDPMDMSKFNKKENIILRGQTEVLAKANFRTIVRNYQFSETDNGRELAAKSAGL